MSDLVKQSFDLAQPTQALEVAEILQKFVKEKKLTTKIQNKDYPLVEAWQFAGSQLGLYPILTEVKDLSTEKEIKHQACVEIRRISNDQVVSRGYALCSNREPSKSRFDEYAILSMAQTRAEGKAFRMILAWLMKAAGFEATPAEEMDFKTNGAETNDFLFFWENELANCQKKGDLLNLYNGNVETVKASPEIQQMFKRREKELKA